MDTITKYPRTPHLQGSRLQKGDEDISQVPYSYLAGKYIVIEEKMDGGNSGLRFSIQAELLRQSRGHYLVGGSREKHFDQLKVWSSVHQDSLFDVLSDRYLMFGEWMHSKHTVYYDRLPHLFLEFDIYDTHRDIFLSTAARRDLIGDTPIVSVPVLYEGIAPKRLEDLLAFIKPSLAKSRRWRESLQETVTRQGLDLERVLAQTENSDLAEGLYIKVENGHETVGRLKWVRADFVQTITEEDSHWLSRPIIPNRLAPGVDIFADKLTVTWEDIERMQAAEAEDATEFRFV